MRRVLAALVFAASTACAQADPFPGYVKASAEERAAVVRIVDDYYAKRSRASASRDTTELFASYPRLVENGDRQRGINSDDFLVERMVISDIARISVELEQREPIRVLVRGDDALAFVHGAETWHYRHGTPGMGEFFTQLELKRIATGWTIERTDEHQLGERWPPRTPRP